MIATQADRVIPRLRERGPAELRRHEHQSIIEQPASAQIAQEPRDRAIDAAGLEPVVELSCLRVRPSFAAGCRRCRLSTPARIGRLVRATAERASKPGRNPWLPAGRYRRAIGSPDSRLSIRRPEEPRSASGRPSRSHGSALRERHRRGAARCGCGSSRRPARACLLSASGLTGTGRKEVVDGLSPAGGSPRLDAGRAENRSSS